MSITIDYETEQQLEVDYERIIREIIEESLDYEGVPLRGGNQRSHNG